MKGWMSEASFPSRLEAAFAYEQSAKVYGFAIPLGGKDRPFWSRGWMACKCHQPLDDWTTPLTYKEKRENGQVTKGWYCHAQGK